MGRVWLPPRSRTSSVGPKSSGREPLPLCSSSQRFSCGGGEGACAGGLVSWSLCKPFQHHRPNLAEPQPKHMLQRLCQKRTLPGRTLRTRSVVGSAAKHTSSWASTAPSRRRRSDSWRCSCVTGEDTQSDAVSRLMVKRMHAFVCSRAKSAAESGMHLTSGQTSQPAPKDAAALPAVQSCDTTRRTTGPETPSAVQ